MIRSINQSRSECRLIVSGMSWKNKLNSLFDYQDNNIESFVPFKEQLEAKQAYLYIFRNRSTHKIEIVSKKKLKVLRQKDIPETLELICACKVICQNRRFEMKMYQPEEVQEEQSESSECLQDDFNEYYLVVRSLKDKYNEPTGHVLMFLSEPKDIFRLGNCEFFIHSVQIDGKRTYVIRNNSNRETENAESEEQGLEKTKELCSFFVSNNQKIYDADKQTIDKTNLECKYCLMEETDKYGEFLCAPCKCSGSCGLVHYKCLVKWNENKTKKTENKGFVQYDFDNFFCEVCQEEYPQFIKKQKTLYEIMPIESPKGDCMVIESFCKEKRHIIVINEIKDQEIVFGRGAESDIKINSNSLSRRHAVIRRLNGEYAIFDQKSKFGTLVRHPSLQFPIRSDNKISVQSGRSLLCFGIEEKL